MTDYEYEQALPDLWYCFDPNDKTRLGFGATQRLSYDDFSRIYHYEVTE